MQKTKPKKAFSFGILRLMAQRSLRFWSFIGPSLKCMLLKKDIELPDPIGCVIEASCSFILGMVGVERINETPKSLPTNPSYMCRKQERALGGAQASSHPEQALMGRNHPAIGSQKPSDHQSKMQVPNLLHVCSFHIRLPLSIHASSLLSWVSDGRKPSSRWARPASPFPPEPSPSSQLPPEQFSLQTFREIHLYLGGWAFPLPGTPLPTNRCPTPPLHLG